MWVEYKYSTHIILSYNDLENFYIPDQSPGTTYRVYKKLFGYQNGSDEFAVDCTLPLYILNQNYIIELESIEISGIGEITIDSKIETEIYSNYTCTIRIPLNGNSGTIRYTTIILNLKFL